MRLFKKILKILSFVFLGVVLLLLVAGIFIDPIAKNFIENQINEADEGQYTAQIDDVNVSILRGNLILNGVTILTDTISARENETPVVTLEAGEVSAEGVSWLNFLITNNLQLDRVSVIDLVAEAKVRTTETADTLGPFKWEHLDIYPLIKNQIDRVRLNDLRFNNINLTLLNIESNDTLKFNAEEFFVHSDDILIDADRVFTDARAFYASRIDIQGKDVKIERSGHPQWQAELELIAFETRESDFGVHSENVLFFKKGQSERDTVFFVSIGQFNLDNLNLNRVQEDSVAKIENVALSKMTIINNIDIDEEDIKQADKKSAGFDISKFSVGDHLPDLLDKIIIKEIDLEQISYKELEHLSIKNIGFHARETTVDQHPAFAGNRFLHTNQIDFTVGSIDYLIRDSKLQITLDDLDLSVNAGTGNFTIQSIQASNYERLPQETYFESAIDGFKITGIDTRELENKILSIDSIAIEQPELLVHLVHGGNDVGKNRDDAPLDLFPLIENALRELSIDKIALINGDISVSGMEGNQSLARFPAVYVQLSDVFIAEGSAFTENRTLHADDIAVRMEQISFPLPDNVYTAKLDLLNLSTREKFISGHGLSYDYNENISKIFKGPETNQAVKFYSENFLIDNLEFVSLIQERGFFAGSITSESLEIEIFKDNNFPVQESDNLPATPQQMIKDIEFPFYLGSLSVDNANIIFTELAEGATDPGQFTVDDVALHLRDFTNVDNIIRNKPTAVLELNGKLMGEGFFQTKIEIPMLDDDQPVKIAGKVDTLDLTQLNQYTEFTTRFGIESGTLYKIRWDFESGEEQAAGNFGLSYEGLNVQLSESDSPAPAGTLYQIGAYLANALVLDTDISEENSDPPKTVEFEREKEEEESFIEHYISSLMAGFLEIMGFPLSIIDP